MNNPYEAPKSNLEVPYEFKRSVWWKIYFVVMTLLSVLGMASYLTQPNAGWAEYLSLFLIIIGTLGLFGFVFLKSIVKPKFWLVFLILYILFSIVYPFITQIDLKMGMSDIDYYINYGIGVLLSLPAYYGLYKYSQPTDPAWNQ